MVRPTWNGSSFSPSSSDSSRNVMRSSRGLAMWSSMWSCRYSNSAIIPSARCSSGRAHALEDVVARSRGRRRRPPRAGRACWRSPARGCAGRTRSAASTTSLAAAWRRSAPRSRPASTARACRSACGEKTGSSIRRASWWNGGSEEIGGAMPAGASSTGGAELAHDDAARREVLGVVGDGGDVLVARRQPHAAVALGVGDRARPAQLVPDRERVGGPGVVGVVEVGGPVGDRRSWLAHQHVLLDGDGPLGAVGHGRRGLARQLRRRRCRRRSPGRCRGRRARTAPAPAR